MRMTQTFIPTLREDPAEAELAGVMAHELAHVQHRDILISTISATMAGAISALANFAVFFGGRDEEGRPANPIAGIAVAILAWLLIGRTKWGFELRVAGDSPDAARYAGINVPRKILGVFLFSGASAGLAGGLLVAGILGRMEPRSLDLGLGFTGIIVAALARLNPIAIIPVAVLMAALINAGPALQSIGIPSATVTMLQGAILIFAVAGEFFIANRIRRPDRKSEPASDQKETASV